jgi:hypothetical protein
MEMIRDWIEWVGNDLGTTIFTLGPYLLLGLLGLYVLWLVIGYLRVSQVGLGEGRAAQPAVPLLAGGESSAEVPRGVPYCRVDKLSFPIGARYCTQCERDLLIDCANCGATLSGGDASCYRCGTPTGVEAFSLLG